jgi:polysaccharide pyruvyl transferase CsaB
MGKGVLIAGYYGAGNTGDEAILAGIIEALRHEGIQDITVLSRNPEATRELHNIESIYIGRRQKGLGAVYRGLRNSSLFILGGGGLLQDHTARVVPFWLSRVGLAFAAGTPVIYYAQGIGPLKTKKARKLVGCFSNKVKYITVRDEPSKLLLEELGVDRVPIEVTADPALAINIRSEGKKLLNQAGVRLLKDSIKVGISLRNWPGEEKYLPVLQKALQELRLRLPVQYIFFPFQYGCDEEVSRQVLEELGGEEDYLVMGTHSPEQVAAMLKEMDAVLAMRLHAVILSSLSCVPAFGVIYDPKVKCYMERAGLEGWSISPEQLAQANAAGQQDLVQLLTDWLMRREEISRRMEPRVEEMRRLTQRNAQLVREMLAGAKG